MRIGIEGVGFAGLGVGVEEEVDAVVFLWRRGEYWYLDERGKRCIFREVS